MEKWGGKCRGDPLVGTTGLQWLREGNLRGVKGACQIAKTRAQCLREAPFCNHCHYSGLHSEAGVGGCEGATEYMTETS